MKGSQHVITVHFQVKVCKHCALIVALHELELVKYHRKYFLLQLLLLLKFEASKLFGILVVRKKYKDAIKDVNQIKLAIVNKFAIVYPV